MLSLARGYDSKHCGTNPECRAIAEGDVAGRPRLVVGLGGIIVSDLVVRPAGNPLMIFGMRETGESMNQRSRMGLLGRLLDSF